MTGYLIRRIVQAIIVVFGVVLLTFLLTKIIPGGYAKAALGQRSTPAAIAQFNHEHYLDRSIFLQFWKYCVALFHGDLGYSYSLNETVASAIQTALPMTLVLIGLSTIFALVVAIPLGILQVVRRNKPIDYVLTGASFIGYAMPAFLLGTLLILWFSIDLNLFEFEAPQTSSIWGILSDPRGWILPVITLSVITIAGFSRYMRSSMMETMTEDYIRTARAKGASPSRVLYSHALRNALIPIITLLGLTLPAIVGGAVITESVFNYRGMGLLTTQAAQRNDVPILLGTTLVAAIATVAGNLIADLLYAVADPRVRYS
ncbi:MAG TPA: ABC transporter permease [Gaiellaceae bacterium]